MDTAGGTKFGRRLRILFLSTLAVLSSYRAACQDVSVSLFEMSPLVSQSENLTILNNSQVNVVAKCGGSTPIEWIADFYSGDPYADTRNWMAWSHRTFNASLDETPYEYSGWIKLRYISLLQPQTLLCRAIDNHSENVTLRIEIDSGRQDQVRVTLHPRLACDSLTCSGSNNSANDEDSCGGVSFEVTQVEDQYYWRCSFNGRAVTVSVLPWEIYYRFAAFCSISYRSGKASPACATIVSNLSSSQVTTDPKWKLFPVLNRHSGGYAGGLVCAATDAAGQTKTASLDFYLHSPPPQNGMIDQSSKLYFSQSDITMKDMIWMDPDLTNSIYYTRQVLHTRCRALMYWFALNPVAIVSVNESSVLFQDKRHESTQLPVDQRLMSQNVTVRLGDYGPGTYQIHCIAPVWNTTEWANQTRTLVVRDSVAPKIQSGIDFQQVWFQDGDMNKSLECDVVGDPEPRVTWDYSNLPGVRVGGQQGRTLTFARVSNALGHAAVVQCKGENEFGESVAKAFQVHVSEAAPAAETSAGNVTILAALTSAFGILLVAGLGYLYWKYRKFGSALGAVLTREEVREFHEGSPAPAPEGAATLFEYVDAQELVQYGEDRELEMIAIECMPYNSEFEVRKENLVVEFNNVLGSGQYGVIYKGKLKRSKKDQSPIPVAVKTVRSNVDICYFKALMSELKILAYIGPYQNENIVNLVGVCSSNIRNRELYVGVELCKTSLLEYLLENRTYFRQNYAEGTEYYDSGMWLNDYQAGVTTDSISPADLARWATEIGSGMEFLSQKRVLHGDLAARNVLLTFELHAKICDFGLARQLIDYKYIKSDRECPLPWKWMAPESLSQRKFTVSSDVWAYGVTLWEIYSLGEVPYPGMGWSIDFLEQLHNGLRMKRPAYANETIFSMILGCWHQNPRLRPKFCDLVEFFQSLESK